MEESWGSPWVTTEKSCTPIIGLPTAPPTAHFSTDSAANSPRRSLHSPWDDNINNITTGGGGNEWTDTPGPKSPRWGRTRGLTADGSTALGSGLRSPIRSPSLKPVVTTSRGVSPDAWNRRRSPSVDRRSDASLGRKLSFNLDAHDVWQSREQVQEEREEEEKENKGLALRGESLGRGQDCRATESEKGCSMREGQSERCRPARADSVSGKVGNSAADESATKQEDTHSTSSKTEVNPKTESGHNGPTQAKDKPSLADPAEDVPHITIGSGDDEPKTSKEAETTTESVSKRPKPLGIKIPIDLRLFDSIFPSTPASDVSPAVVTNSIISDSFTTISERKAWYRLSRPGSMHMHNLGADEDYVRMDWTRSTARQDTLKIVKRWIGEESISGRVALGGKRTANGTTLFNWDSAAPSVDIEDLLRNRNTKRMSYMLPNSKNTPAPIKVSGASGNRHRNSLATISPTRLPGEEQPAPIAKSPNRPQSLALPADFGWGSPQISPVVSSFKPPPSLSPIDAAFIWTSPEDPKPSSPQTATTPFGDKKDDNRFDLPKPSVISTVVTPGFDEWASSTVPSPSSNCSTSPVDQIFTGRSSTTRPLSLIISPVASQSASSEPTKARPQSLCTISAESLGQPSIDYRVSSDSSAPPETNPIELDQDQTGDWGEMVSSPTIKSNQVVDKSIGATVELEVRSSADGSSVSSGTRCSRDSQALESKIPEMETSSPVVNTHAIAQDPWCCEDPCNDPWSNPEPLHWKLESNELSQAYQVAEALEICTQEPPIAVTLLPGSSTIRETPESHELEKDATIIPLVDENTKSLDVPSYLDDKGIGGSKSPELDTIPENDEVTDDERISGILRSLPDLSYMLR